MANINFISARRAERVRIKKWSRWLLILIGFGLTGTVFALGTAGVQTLQLKAKIESTRSQLAQIQPQIDRVNECEKKRKELQPLLLTLNRAQYKTQRWAGVLSGLKRAVPQETWLTNLQVERIGDENTVLRITGVTSDQARVGETMLRLNDQRDYYEKVDLRWTRSTNFPDQEVQDVEFEVAAALNQPELKKDEGDATNTQ